MQLLETPRKFKSNVREISQNFGLEPEEVLTTFEKALASAYQKFNVNAVAPSARINPETGVLNIYDFETGREYDLTGFQLRANTTLNQVMTQKLPLEQIARLHNLNMTVINATLEAALTSAYLKMSKPGNLNLQDLPPVNPPAPKGKNKSQNKNQVKPQPDIEIKIDPDTGGIVLYEIRKVVDVVTNKEKEIAFSDAVRLRHYGHVQLGDSVKIEKNLENFGRIAAQTARQVITQKIRDAERNMLYSTFSEKVGDLVSGTIFKIDSEQIVVNLDDRTDAVLPKKERIMGEKYFPGNVMKFYVLDVKQMTKGPRIVLSRTHPGLLKKLLELEVPEIRDGIIEVKNIVRDAGARAKIAITTLDPNVDPVGACVGNGGERIRLISAALKGEKIDIVIWNPDPLTFIKDALSPAQITKIEPDVTVSNSAKIYVYPDQLSLAIGKSGQNVRLAAKLTEWKLDIISIEPDRMPTLKDIFHEVFDDEQDNKNNNNSETNNNNGGEAEHVEQNTQDEQDGKIEQAEQLEQVEQSVQDEKE